MDLTPQELTYVGVPKEYYDKNYKPSIELSNFIKKEKVYVTRTPKDFFNMVASCSGYLNLNNISVNGAKTYTCQDFTIYSDMRKMYEALSKFQVIGILDIDTTANKRLLESFIRRWFEAGKDLVLLYDKNLKTLSKAGYSDWFVELLSLKEVK